MTDGINTQAVLAMRGAGYYSERTAGARDVINDASEMVLAALEDGPDTPQLRIADLVPPMVAPAANCGIG